MQSIKNNQELHGEPKMENMLKKKAIATFFSTIFF